MVEITYYRSYNRVTITGHALSNEPGKDLVCSAVSSLAYTLAANVQQLEESGYVRNIHVRMDPGDYEVSCTPTTRMRSVVMLMIVKDKSQVGGPLDQFSTIGYKFETNGATILYTERVLRIMSCSSYSATDKKN